MKIIGPLFSLDARGTLGKAITYGANQFGNWVRRIVGRKYTRSDLQNNVRKLFKRGADVWHRVFKPELGQRCEIDVDTNYLWELVNKGNRQAGRCEYLKYYITRKGPNWMHYPLPLRLNRIVVTSRIAQYDQIINDLETLTGLTMCIRPIVLGIDFGLLPIGGFALAPGLIIVVNLKHFDPDGWYRDKWMIAHELTHCLLNQHGYFNILLLHRDHEAMANECADRIVEGNLTPIYTYKGKTMEEIVPIDQCLWVPKGEGDWFSALSVAPSKYSYEPGETVVLDIGLRNNTKFQMEALCDVIIKNPLAPGPIKEWSLGPTEHILFDPYQIKTITYERDSSDWPYGVYAVEVEVRKQAPLKANQVYYTYREFKNVFEIVLLP